MAKTNDSNRLCVGIVQCALNEQRELNVARVVGHVREAAARGAQILALPELFEGPYFPREEDELYFEWARPLEDNPTLQRLREVAKELSIVLPYSWFERAGQAFYDSVAMIDATGEVLGVYRKAHIPDGAGTREKHYFRPGDTGFRVWSTRHGRVGVGLGWDVWFPECARAMALMGAELLLYPTAIGAERAGRDDPKDRWQRVACGHAVANALPVASANRIGDEGARTFSGSSFIADPHGARVAELPRDEAGIAVHELDRKALARQRAAWGIYRDRRPDLYRALLGADGASPTPKKP